MGAAVIAFRKGLGRSVAVAVGVIAALAGCGRFHSQAGDPEAAANAFFAALENRDARAAYDGSAFGFQAGQTFDAFVANVRQLDLEGGQPPAWVGKDVQQTEARLYGTVVNRVGAPVKISLILTQDRGAWRIFSLRTATGQEPETNRFTLIGKGVGFNDVYQQPMLDPQSVADLIHNTMAGFNGAIRTGNFHQFYRSVSQQWKDGQLLTGESERMAADEAQNEQARNEIRWGLTENILKTHFQAFIDKKIDLSGLADLQPVLEQSPLINQYGILELHGHFDMVQFRVHFHLEYVYELPHWKVAGIDLALSK